MDLSQYLPLLIYYLFGSIPIEKFYNKLPKKETNLSPLPPGGAPGVCARATLDPIQAPKYVFNAQAIFWDFSCLLNGGDQS